MTNRKMLQKLYWASVALAVFFFVAYSSMPFYFLFIK